MFTSPELDVHMMLMLQGHFGALAGGMPQSINVTPEEREAIDRVLSSPFVCIHGLPVISV